MSTLNITIILAGTGEILAGTGERNSYKNDQQDATV